MLTGTVRFKIPFFQRGYAWEKKQWDQLFLDLQEQIIDELEAGTGMEQVEHFFGPVVVMEETGTPELKEFLVVDGQQRITTIYLLLGIIRCRSTPRSTCRAMPTAISMNWRSIFSTTLMVPTTT